VFRIKHELFFVDKIAKPVFLDNMLQSGHDVCEFIC
jgi:hypothetical protein